MIFTNFSPQVLSRKINSGELFITYTKYCRVSVPCVRANKKFLPQDDKNDVKTEVEGKKTLKGRESGCVKRKFCAFCLCGEICSQRAKNKDFVCGEVVKNVEVPVRECFFCCVFLGNGVRVLFGLICEICEYPIGKL